MTDDQPQTRLTRRLLVAALAGLVAGVVIVAALSAVSPALGGLEVSLVWLAAFALGAGVTFTRLR